MLFTILIGFTFIGQLIAEEDISSRIYHGTAASKGQFPFMVRTLLVHEFSNVTHVYTFCGASLITDKWVVSAAHCTIGAVSAYVTLGMLNTNNNNGTLTYTVPKSGIFVHPGYVPNTFPSPDIALYKLPSSVPFNNYPYIKTITIPNLGPNSASKLEGSLVTVVGWGTTESGQGSSDLLYAVVKVLNNSECIMRFSPGATTSTICTDKHYKDSGPCPGDSGGPLIADGKNGPELVGITSFGVGDGSACSDPNGGSVYTFTPFYKDWIQKTISSN